MQAVTPSKPYPLNIIDQIPTNSAIKMVALNALAFTGGAALQFSAPLILTVPVTLAIAYTCGKGIQEMIKAPDKDITPLKVAQASVILLSFTAGAVSGNLALSALIIQKLFVTAATTSHGLSAVIGMKKLAIAIGVTYPITLFIDRVVYHTFDTLFSYTKEGASMLTNYRIFRMVLNQPWCTTEKAVALLTQYKSISKVDFDPTQVANDFFIKALERSTDDEFSEFLQNKMATGQVPLEHIVGNKRFGEFYAKNIKKKAEGAIKFCNGLDKKIENAKDQISVEKLQDEMTVQTQNALLCKKLLEHYPNVDANQEKLKNDLNDYYNRFLANIDENTYRGKLRALARSMEQPEEDDTDEDIIFVLPDIFRERDCQEYVRELQIPNQEGKSYAAIFHEELVRLGLDTRGGLTKAVYFPIPATVDGKKRKLIDIVKIAKQNQSPVNVIKEMTQGGNVETGNKVATFAKRAFFGICMLGSVAVVAAESPYIVLVSAAAALYFKEPSELLKTLDSLLPTDTSFAASRTAGEYARRFAISIIAYSNPLYIGVKTAAVVKGLL